MTPLRLCFIAEHTSAVLQIGLIGAYNNIGSVIRYAVPSFNLHWPKLLIRAII